MRLLLLFLLAFCPFLHLKAQNWRPLQPGYVYQYDDPTGKYYSQNSGLNHLKVISKTVEGNDSVYYLNTAAIKVQPSIEQVLYLSESQPNLKFSVTLENGLLVKNQPYFLNKKVRISGDEWIFEGDDTFILKPDADTGATWTFSAARSITAEVTGIRQESFFGITDHVKTITLSTGNVIKLSKNHGIISFPTFNGNYKSYGLKGVEGPDIGIIIPLGRRIYDFQPGDIFQYYHKDNNYLEQGEYVRQVTIQTRTDLGNAVSYKTREIKFKDGKVYLATKTYQYGFEVYDPLNQYPGEIPANSPGSEGHDYSFTLGRDGRHSQNRESYFFWQSVEQGSDTLYPYTPIVCADWKSDYASGLGMTYNYEIGLSGTFESSLTAFRKTDGSSMGTLMNIDTTTSVKDIENSSLRLQVYPNPASGETMNITGHLSRPGVLQFTLTDLQGRNIVAGPAADLPAGDFNQPMNIGQVSPGMYLLRLNGSGVNEVLKVSVVN